MVPLMVPVPPRAGREGGLGQARAALGAEGQHPCGRVAWQPFGRTAVEGSIVARFRAQARAHDGCLAVDDGEVRWTYGSLAERVELIAGDLSRAGCHPGERVVLLMPQGAPAIAAVLGTLAAGCAYVPLDPDEPDARIESLLARVSAAAIVTDAGRTARARRLAAGRPVVPAEHPPTERRDETGDRPDALPDVTPDAVASVYLTSGSTGEPKGVVDSHRNVLHNVMRYTDALRIGPGDRLTLLHSPAFSGAASSTFCALLNGAAVFPFDLARHGVARVADWMRAERVTIYHSVPSIWRSALAQGGSFPDVRVVRLEGDRALAGDVALWKRHFARGSILANGLGTTETGLCRQLLVDAGTIVDEGVLPVGYALPDMEVSVLDETGGAVAEGEVGEIAVTSEFLASGYLDRDDLTRSAFIEMPGRPGVRTYRTGDLGRFRPDGCLEYLGRRDGQLKVLGHRVEPAEVEATLVHIPGVREAAVRTVEGRPGEGRLVGYIVSDEPIDEPTLMRELAARLPPWMRPWPVVRLERLPLAASGKVDRAALPLPLAGPSQVADTTSADDPLATQVAAVVQSVLGRSVGVQDDFFLAGGDSLDAAVVLAGLEACTRRQLPSSFVARAPTVSLMAAALREPVGDTSAPSLYPLRATGGGTPLVIVHAHHGHSLIYARLARHLETDGPVWALDLASEAGDDLRVESIARAHVATLREVLPDGPYHLAGYCYGGAVALEMARQLLSGERAVGMLTVLGVSPPDFPGLLAPATVEAWHRSRRPARRLLDLSGHVVALGREERRAYVAERARAVRRYLTDRVSPSRQARHRLSRSAQAAFAAYRPGPYDGRVTLILAQASTARYTSDPGRDWAALGSDVRVHLVPGSDRDMLREPVVSMVADALSREMAASAAQGSPSA